MDISHSHLFIRTIFTLTLILTSVSVEAVLVSPTKEAPEGFHKIKSPRKVKHDCVGSYYEEGDDKAQTFLKSKKKPFYQRNKASSETRTSVKFMPRDESFDDKAQDLPTGEKSLHQRNKSYLKTRTSVKFIPRDDSCGEEEQNDDEDFSSKERDSLQSKKIKLDRDVVSSDDEEEKVIGAKDGRQKIDTPWEFPHCVHGHMRMEIGTRVYIGSGTMIDEAHVLTAGHNLFFKEFQSAPDKITFFPGLHGKKAKWKAKAISWITHPRYVNPDTPKVEVKKHDIGLITLERSIGEETGYMDLDKLEKKRLEQAQLTVKGYPGDLGKGSFMYSMIGPVMTVERHQVSYNIDTAGGQSGSGVFDETNTIRCVHTYGGTNKTGNKGTRINQNFKDLIEDWKKL